MIITDLLVRITDEIVNPLIVLVFLLAVVAFGWGMVMYLAAQGSDEKVQKGKKIMWWGIIGMFVLASMWGAVFLLCDFSGICVDAVTSDSSRVRFSFPSFSPGDGIVNPDAGMNPGGGGRPGDGNQLIPSQEAVCSNTARCEPCLHFLDEGNPRAYVRCVRGILGF